MTNSSFPHPNTPFVDSNGYLEFNWYNFLSQSLAAVPTSQLNALIESYLQSLPSTPPATPNSPYWLANVLTRTPP